MRNRENYQISIGPEQNPHEQTTHLLFDYISNWLIYIGSIQFASMATSTYRVELEFLSSEVDSTDHVIHSLKGGLRGRFHIGGSEGTGSASNKGEDSCCLHGGVYYCIIVTGWLELVLIAAEYAQGR